MTAVTDAALGVDLALGLHRLADLLSTGRAPLPDTGVLTVTYLTASLAAVDVFAVELDLATDVHPEGAAIVTGADVRFGPVVVRVEHHQQVTSGTTAATMRGAA